MFQSTVSKIESGEEEEFCLLVNPSGNTKIASDIFHKLTTSGKATKWRVYVKPTVTSNGTAQTVVDDNGTTTALNTVSLYKSPTVTSYGTKVREFTVPKGPLRYYSNTPYIELQPGDSLLLRRTTKGCGTITTIFQWTEK